MMDVRSAVPALLLAILLAWAVTTDVRSRRIPNQLVLWGALGSFHWKPSTPNCPTCWPLPAVFRLLGPTR